PDATGSPGSPTPVTNPWTPGPANVNDKGDLCSMGSAREVLPEPTVGGAAAVAHAVPCCCFTRFDGAAHGSVLQTLEGPAARRCDGLLIAFRYTSSTETFNLDVRRWVPAGTGTPGSPAALAACAANPNGAGQWVLTTDPVNFDWATGTRTEGPA